MVEAGGGLLEHLDRLAIRSVASAPGLISPAMRSARPSARQFELLTREWGAPASAPSAMGKERLRAPAGKETAVKAHVTRVLLKIELNADGHRGSRRTQDAPGRAGDLAVSSMF